MKIDFDVKWELQTGHVWDDDDNSVKQSYRLIWLIYSILFVLKRMSSFDFEEGNVVQYKAVTVDWVKYKSIGLSDNLGFTSKFFKCKILQIDVMNSFVVAFALIEKTKGSNNSMWIL